MTHGLKVLSAAGKAKIITPDDGTVIAAGSKTMSNSLNGDNTYGEDIALGATYNEDEIGVLVVPRRPVFGVNYNRYIDDGTLYYDVGSNAYLYYAYSWDDAAPANTSSFSSSSNRDFSIYCTYTPSGGPTWTPKTSFIM